MRWFQYRAGIVLDSLRVAHCEVLSTDGGLLRSWCRRTFRADQVEEVSEPDRSPEPGMAAPMGPCVPCLLLVMAATDVTSEATNEPRLMKELPATERR